MVGPYTVSLSYLQLFVTQSYATLHETLKIYLSIIHSR